MKTNLVFLLSKEWLSFDTLKAQRFWIYIQRLFKTKDNCLFSNSYFNTSPSHFKPNKCECHSDYL